MCEFESKQIIINRENIIFKKSEHPKLSSNLKQTIINECTFYVCNHHVRMKTLSRRKGQTSN